MKNINLLIHVQERNGDQEYIIPYIVSAVEQDNGIDKAIEFVLKTWYDDGNVEYDRTTNSYNFSNGINVRCKRWTIIDEDESKVLKKYI